MAWVAVDKDKTCWLHEFYPTRAKRVWYSSNPIQLSQNSIKKLIGRELTWDDDPVEI